MWTDRSFWLPWNTDGKCNVYGIWEKTSLFFASLNPPIHYSGLVISFACIPMIFWLPMWENKYKSVYWWDFFHHRSEVLITFRLPLDSGKKIQRQNFYNLRSCKWAGKNTNRIHGIKWKKICVCIYLVWIRGSSLKFMCMFMLTIEYFHVDDFLFTIKLRIVLKYWMSLVWLFGNIPAVFFLVTISSTYVIQNTLHSNAFCRRFTLTTLSQSQQNLIISMRRISSMYSKNK